MGLVMASRCETVGCARQGWLCLWDERLCNVNAATCAMTPCAGEGGLDQRGGQGDCQALAQVGGSRERPEMCSLA